MLCRGVLYTPFTQIELFGTTSFCILAFPARAARTRKTTRFKSSSQKFSLKLTAPSALSNSPTLSENLQNPIRISNSLQFSPLHSTSSQNHTTFTFKIIALDFINKIIGILDVFSLKSHFYGLRACPKSLKIAFAS